jgi:hypothetical protein
MDVEAGPHETHDDIGLDIGESVLAFCSCPLDRCVEIEA